ncbi:MAG TPA: tetratricopeptide repeat protein [Beijerinckiaceae bacterium]|nr:tetratricopeptide repeat protein [Beijerinckiaceae bacterium]
MRGRRLSAGAVAVAVLLGLAGAPAQGQIQAPVVDPTGQYDALFRQVLADPANVELSFRFAEVATRLGDYEAAIGALERILFYNPNLPRVQLELGVLYFRLGSYEMARSYFSSALEAPDAPAEIRMRVSGFLFEIERRLSATRLSVFAQMGIRHQTNANAGPTSPLVRAVGRDAVLDRQFANRPDWNFFSLGTVRHVHDFENQRGDVWETTLVGYYARQYRIQRLNLGLFEVQTGPRLALAPDALPGASFRPYVLGNLVTLADTRYLNSIGAGLSFSLPVVPGFLVEPFVEVRERRFSNSFEYRTASEQTGRLWSGGVLVQAALAPQIRAVARLAYGNNDARRDYNSYDQVSVDLGFPIEFAGPSGGRPWALVPSIGFTNTRYDIPNPVIDPRIVRRDSEWRVGALLDVPIHEAIGLGVQVQYTKVNSNLPNYDTRNLSVTFGPTFRF